MSDNNIVSGRDFKVFALQNTPELKRQMLNWANRFNICCFMDNHFYEGKHQSYECLLAVGAWKWVKLNAGNALDLLGSFRTGINDWLFGHVGFGIQKELYGIDNDHRDPAGFADAYFFVPEHLLLLKQGTLQISSYSMDESVLLREILAVADPQELRPEPLRWSAQFTREGYIDTIKKLQAHIHRGDCYEINFCQAFSAWNAVIDPPKIFWELGNQSPTPFAVYYRIEDAHLLCASPERYFRTETGKVWSQPIKGTAGRDTKDPRADKAIAHQLRESAKEQAENVMVVDLVRNDLSRVCKPGTVTVEELFGIYPFPQVYQMISTVMGELLEGKDWLDILTVSFPMGSMSGAPKKRVLELIRQYELGGRGIFSGTVGYVDPDGRADFNVVIRSILYNKATGYLGYLVGSGITGYADAAAEYEECLLKAAAIMAVLNNTGE